MTIRGPESEVEFFGDGRKLVVGAAAEWGEVNDYNEG